MKVLGLIPARGGSKGIPQKNIRLLAGRPLLAYTAEAARNSRLLTDVILSTDDPGIAEAGRQLGLQVPFLRPAEHSDDDATALQVIQHALQTIAATQEYDAVAFLQPTSPLRTAKHIDAAIELLVSSNSDSVVSVVPVPHHFSPTSLMKLEAGTLTGFWPGEPITRRQDKPRLYARNGPAVLVSRTEVFLQQEKLYGEQCQPLIMSEHDSVDIDTLEDLEYAAYLLSRRQAA